LPGQLVAFFRRQREELRIAQEQRMLPIHRGWCR
jgi:hypothetical protein